jgi:adenylyl-sulfate kinase
MSAVPQAGFVVWMTGLPASGKSTTAQALLHALVARGRRAYVLDGDEIRKGLNRDLGFSAKDRSENIRRVSEVARLLCNAGVICITALISPLRADRASARKIVGDRFIEVFVDTHPSVCEARDPKGHYKKARAGLLPDFTGVGAPYEPPREPEIHLREGDLDQHVAQILAWLQQRNLL